MVVRLTVEGIPMRASDLVGPHPTVALSSPAIEAARLLATADLPGLIIVGDAGRPVTVLPGTQVPRMAVPAYCQADPSLARVIDEVAADVILTELDDLTV